MSYFSIEVPTIHTENFIEVIKNREFPFYLDSGGYFKRLGRYSFFGFNPLYTFNFKNGVVNINKNGTIEKLNIAPFDYLKNALEQFKVIKENKKFPFQGGFVGYLSYELGKYIEELPDSRSDDYNLPEIYFGVYDVIYVYDYLENRLYIAGYNFDENSEKKVELYKKALKNIKTDDSNFKIGKHLESNFTKEKFKDTISQAKEYIFAGDIYQVNLSQRFHTDFSGDAYEFYKNFRNISPAPFGAFLDYGSFQILSNSPERYLLISNDHIETRPIKGTRKRGKDSVEDEMLKQELINSDKDKAEHLMIVDLERNDLGRIAKFNSVKVSEFEIIETYANVHHMVSTVEAKIDKRFHIVDCIKNSYPGGSITGAPKIRAMEIIDELEPTYRSVYTGSIGYISFDGDLDLNIAIRTAIIKDNTIYFQVGGGIVADSDPEDEYIETIVKAESFTKTLKGIVNG